MNSPETEQESVQEPVQEEISRGKWMAQLHSNAEKSLGQMNIYLEKYREWEKHLHECNRVFLKVGNLERNQYRLRYFVDEVGNLSFRAEEKGDIGFGRGGE